MSDIVDLVEGGPPFARNERAVVVVRDAAEPELDFSFRDRSTDRFIGPDGWSGEPVFHTGRRVTLPDGRTGYSVGSTVTQHLRLSGAFRIETRTGLGAEIVSRVATFYPTKPTAGIGFDAPPPPEPPRAPADRPGVDGTPPRAPPKPAEPARPPPPVSAPVAEPFPVVQPVSTPEPLPAPLRLPDLPAAPPPGPPPLPVPSPVPGPPPPVLEPPQIPQPPEPLPLPLPALETAALPAPLPELEPALVPEPLPLPPAPPIAALVPPAPAATGRRIVWIALALLLLAGAAVAYVLKAGADADDALFQSAVACYRQAGACGAPGCFAEYQSTYPRGRHAPDVVAILEGAQNECRPFVLPTPRPQPRPQPAPPPQPTTSYYYIGNLRNTNGDDDWLALRSEPRRDRQNYDVAFSRANMRNGTLLIFLGQQNDFYKVRLLTGQEGWANSQFILCCRSP